MANQPAKREPAPSSLADFFSAGHLFWTHTFHRTSPLHIVRARKLVSHDSFFAYVGARDTFFLATFRIGTGLPPRGPSRGSHMHDQVGTPGNSPHLKRLGLTHPNRGPTHSSREKKNLPPKLRHVAGRYEG